MHAQSGWDREIDLAIAEYYTYFNLQKLLGWFYIVHLYYEAQSNQLCYIWLNQGRHLNTWEFFQLLLSSVTLSLNISNPVPLEAMHAHAITLLHHISQRMLHALDHELFQAFSIHFSSCHSGTGWSSFQPSKECVSRSGLDFLDVF